MLGIMNCNDTVDFYATNPKEDDKSNNELRKVFEHGTSIRRRNKPKISYTTDGRRLINGKPIKPADDNVPYKMWSELFQRSTAVKLQKADETTKSDEDETAETTKANDDKNCEETTNNDEDETAKTTKANDDKNGEVRIKKLKHHCARLKVDGLAKKQKSIEVVEFTAPQSI